MTATTDRERRQLRLIADRLRAYRLRELSLARLIGDLDALWNELRLVSADWSDEFRGHWWILEQVHAVALDHGQDTLPADLQVLVDDAADQLRFLVDEAILPGGDANDVGTADAAH